MNIKTSFFILILLINSSSLLTQTTVQKNEQGWQMLVDGKPFEIKGATFDFVKDLENYDKHFKDLQFLGVNTIRTWTTGKETKALLDAAQKQRCLFTFTKRMESCLTFLQGTWEIWMLFL